jgi:hypothetical protein
MFKAGDKLVRDYNLELLRIARAEADKRRRLLEVSLVNGRVK